MLNVYVSTDDNYRHERDDVLGLFGGPIAQHIMHLKPCFLLPTFPIKHH